MVVAAAVVASVAFEDVDGVLPVAAAARWRHHRHQVAFRLAMQDPDGTYPFGYPF